MKELNIKVPVSTTETNVNVKIPDAVITQGKMTATETASGVNITMSLATAVQPDPTYTLSGGTPPVVTPPVDPPPVPGASVTLKPVQRTDAWAPGHEDWHGWLTATGVPKAQSRYYRFTWKELQTAEGVYKWDAFDTQVRAAIAQGQLFSFGLMTVYIGNRSASAVRIGSNYSSSPAYLIDKGMKYWVKGQDIVPNWNDEIYLSEHGKLLTAWNKHINEMGWQDVINYVDIRGYGNWGEWHSYGIVNADVKEYPAGMDATDATKKRLIKQHFDAFPDQQMVLLMSALDANMWANTRNSADVGRYALGLTNSRGGAGWRRDNWGLIERYDNYFNSNNPLWSLFKDRWATAPVVGEPNNGETEYGGSAPMWALKKQVQDLHVAFMGNGNMNGDQALPAAWNTNAAAGIAAAGHRLTLVGGSYANGTLTLNWSNTGVANVYENARVVAVVGGKEYPLSASVVKKNGTWQTGDIIALPAGDLYIVVKNNYRTIPVGYTGKVATL